MSEISYIKMLCWFSSHLIFFFLKTSVTLALSSTHEHWVSMQYGASCWFLIDWVTLATCLQLVRLSTTSPNHKHKILVTTSLNHKYKILVTVKSTIAWLLICIGRRYEIEGIVILGDKKHIMIQPLTHSNTIKYGPCGSGNHSTQRQKG